MKKIFFFLFVYTFISSAHALCYSSRYEILSWNKSGTALLYHKGIYGPEGGGGHYYGIIDFKSKNQTEKLLSSYSQPTVGGHYQEVSQADCNKEISILNKKMKSLSFSNFKLQGCSEEKITLSSNHSKKDYSVNNELLNTVIKENIEKNTRKGMDDIRKETFQAYSKNKKNFVVIRRPQFCESILDSYFFNSKEKKFEKLILNAK